MKPLLTFLTLFLMLGGVASAKNCTDKDEKYAKEDSITYQNKRTFTAEESYLFGIEIIETFKKKDLKKLVSMFDGELTAGPKKSYFDNKTFDQAFQKRFIDLIVNSKPRCALSDSNMGFDVGNTLIWYDKNKQNKWVIRRINYK
ncbi:hypothetical protein N8444_03085 [Pelagibacteraceae bacterium]|nr:hypothetical protein [Pelagibacteraceae bacterium]